MQPPFLLLRSAHKRGRRQRSRSLRLPGQCVQPKQDGTGACAQDGNPTKRETPTAFARGSQRRMRHPPLEPHANQKRWHPKKQREKHHAKAQKQFQKFGLSPTSGLWWRLICFPACEPTQHAKLTLSPKLSAATNWEQRGDITNGILPAYTHKAPSFPTQF
ncbi:hypothetical protein TraAM80_09639, partial [Trypanosoma rangeli]